MARLIKRLAAGTGAVKPRSRATGHAEIAAVLGSEILSGVRAPGSRLPSPQEMHALFGVSRVVLREVTKTLAAKGMVTSKTKVGTQVLDPAHWNWLDPDVLAWRVDLGLDTALLVHIAQVRHAVEPAAAALAARNRTKPDLARMKAALKAMAESGGSTHMFAEADLAFHVAISAASGNPLFRSFTAVIDVAMAGFLSLTSVGAMTDEKDHTRSVARHARVLEAIEARDESAAEKAMERVLEAGMRHAGPARPVVR